MIKREIIEKHLEDMATRVGRLRRYQQLSSEEFTTDWQAIYAAERGLQTAIQNLIDIGAHILAGLGDSQWNEYREIPLCLARRHIIPESHVKTLQEMIGMRNILVHQYVEVDVKKVYAILREHLDDFDHFARQIKRFLVKDRSC
jgi:uncharacterized protein YutE (UPF0331/DUF86 family)